MHQFLSWALAIAAFLLFAGTVEQARQARGGSRKASGGKARKEGFLAHRRRLREMREKHRLDGAREEARDERARQREEARDERARQREREREDRQRVRDRERYGDDAPPPRRNVKSFITLRPEKPGGHHRDDDCPPAPVPPGAEEDGAPAGRGASPRAPGGGTREPSPPPPGPPRPPGPSGPPRQQPPASQPQSPPAPATAPANGGTTTVTTPAIYTGIEDMLTAIDRLGATALSGNALAKLGTLKACALAAVRFDQMAQSIARSMSEQGHFGTEITERVSTAGIHQMASASAFSDGANALESLLSMRLGEVPGSGRQAPHHTELSETGAR